jgi:hypothetical protein
LPLKPRDTNSEIQNNLNEGEERKFEKYGSYNLLDNREEKKSCLGEGLPNPSRNCGKKLAISEFSLNDNEKALSNFDRSSIGDVDQNTREVIIEKNENSAMCRGCIIY